MLLTGCADLPLASLSGYRQLPLATRLLRGMLRVSHASASRTLGGENSQIWELSLPFRTKMGYSLFGISIYFDIHSYCHFVLLIYVTLCDYS